MTNSLSFVVILSFLLYAPTASATVLESREHHDVQLLNAGMSSLEKRLEAIESAEVSIEAEYFYLWKDAAGRLFLQELLRKAQSGVKVRLIVDHFFLSAQMAGTEGENLARLGYGNFELRHYNPFPVPGFLNHRNHRKILIIDGRDAIIGGRNVGDEYFDLSARYNFLDRDIWFSGPIVRELRSDFDRYWNSFLVVGMNSNTVSGRADKDEALEDYEKIDEFTESLFPVTAADIALRDEVRRLGREQLRSEYWGACHDVTIATDPPRLRVNLNPLLNPVDHVLDVLGDRTPLPHLSSVTPNPLDLFSETVFFQSDIVKEIYRRMTPLSEGDRLTIENPYFIPTDLVAKGLTVLLDRGVEVDLLTNSLRSTDASPIVSIFNKRSEQYIRRGMDVSVYSALPLPGAALTSDDVGEARWGIHAKTMVIGEDRTVIGTFNIDPRSKNLNSEIVFICDDQPALAAAVRESILERTAHSATITPDGDLDWPPSLEHMSPDLLFEIETKDRVLFHLIGVPSSMLDFLL
ncbi:MAG: phospholipase D family protein [Inquilinus sp.]|nr:phospholipase D family protein [Inquilinus sp.]